MPPFYLGYTLPCWPSLGHVSWDLQMDRRLQIVPPVQSGSPSPSNSTYSCLGCLLDVSLRILTPAYHVLSPPPLTDEYSWGWEGQEVPQWIIFHPTYSFRWPEQLLSRLSTTLKFNSPPFFLLIYSSEEPMLIQ